MRVAVPFLTVSTLLLTALSLRGIQMQVHDTENRIRQEIEENHAEQVAAIRGYAASQKERLLRYGEQLEAMMPRRGDGSGLWPATRLPSAAGLPGLQGVVLFRNMQRVYPALPVGDSFAGKGGALELGLALQREQALLRGRGSESAFAAVHDNAMRLLAHPALAPAPGHATRFAARELELVRGRKGALYERIAEQDSLLRVQDGHALVAQYLSRDMAEALRANLRDSSLAWTALDGHFVLVVRHGPTQVVGIFDRAPALKALLGEIRASRSHWRVGRISLRSGKEWVTRADENSDRSLAVETVFEEGTAPVSQLLTYQPPARVLRKMSRRVALLQALLVLCVLATLLVALFATLRSIRNERNLLAMKSNFLSAVTHELKTPLTSIRMFADTIASGRARTPEKVSEYALRIQAESIRLQQMAEDVLCYNRLERGISGNEREELDLSQRCRETVERLLPLAVRKGVSLNYSSSGDTTLVADRRSIDSMIGNLVDNAVKYTPSGGTVEVTAENRNGCPTLVVADTGIGIPEAEQGKIFDVFYRVGDEMTRSTTGSGLGLAIVRESVEFHGAHLSLHSAPGKGTVFTITFGRNDNG